MSISSCGRPAAVFRVVEAGEPEPACGRHVRFDGCGTQRLVVLDSGHGLHDVQAAEARAQHPVAAPRQPFDIRRDPELLAAEVVGEQRLGVKRAEGFG